MAGRVARRSAVADAVRRDERGELDRHERIAVPPPVRRRPASCSATSPSTPRRNAGLNPNAIYRDPFTLDDYFDARMVTTPFGLYDCDVPCDGAMAVIVSAADVAADLPTSGDPHRGRGHADHRTAVVGPGHGHPRAAGHRTVDASVDAHVAHARRHRRRPALRRVHVQLRDVDRGARLLRLRRGEGLDRRRPHDRPRRHAPAEPARRPAVRGPHARHGLLLRSRHAAPRRGR